jgi:hypothetical protein
MRGNWGLNAHSMLIAPLAKGVVRDIDTMQAAVATP